MLKLDLEVGVSMWEEVLEYYHNRTFPVDYSDLTCGVVEETDTYTLIEIFSDNSTIVDYVFKRDPYDSHLKIDLFIRDLLFEQQYELANTLMLAYMQNGYGNSLKEQILLTAKLYQT